MTQHPATKGFEAIMPMHLVEALSRDAWIKSNRCPKCSAGMGRNCAHKTYCSERVAIVADKF